MTMKQIGLFTSQVDPIDPNRPPPWVLELPRPVTHIWEACRRATVHLRFGAWGVGRKGQRWIYTAPCACAIGVYLVEAGVPARADESAGGAAARALVVPTSYVYAFAQGFDDYGSVDMADEWVRAGYAMRRLVP